MKVREEANPFLRERRGTLSVQMRIQGVSLQQKMTVKGKAGWPRTKFYIRLGG